MHNKLVAWVSAFCLIQSCFADITVSARADIDMAFDNMLDERELELPVGDMKDSSGIEKIYGDEPDIYCEDLGVASETYGFYKYGSDYGRMYLAEESPGLSECYEDLLEQCEAFEGNYSDIEKKMVNDDPIYYLPTDENKDYKYSLSLGDIRAVVITLINDHPEMYWLESFVYSYYSKDKQYKVLLTINEDYASGKTRHNIDEQIQRNLEGYISIAECFKSQGEYITVKSVHDAIINSVEYAYEDIKIGDETYTIPSTAASAHNIVSVLDDSIETMPVCEAYTEAFQLILNALGIDNVHVTGYALTDFGKEPHAWNLVKLDDGDYYYIDVTWDDQGENGAFYTYFARGSSHFSDHVINTPDDKEGNYLYKLPDVPEGDFEIISYINKSLTNNIEISDSGNCGDNMTWTLYKNGLLYINGAGEMYDFGFDNDLQVSKAPWCKYNSDINFVLTEKGIRSISSFAFWKCNRLISVYFSDGAESMGSYMFGNCWNLNTVKIPESLSGFASNAFEYCSSFSDIYYGGSEAQWNMLDKAAASIPDVTMHYNFPATDIGYQYTVNDISVNDGKAEIELVTTRNPEKAELMLAVYDNGVFSFLLKKPVETGHMVFNDDRIKGSLDYKAFVWNALNEQKPLAKRK